MANNKDPLTAAIIGAAIEVHRMLGPGLFEAVYEECLAWELENRSIPIRRQVPVPVTYKGVKFEASYRVDLLVDERVVVEVKAVDRTAAVHDTQVLTYLRMLDAEVGLLLNFNTSVLKDGIKRFVNSAGRGEGELGDSNRAAETQRRRGLAENSPGG